MTAFWNRFRSLNFIFSDLINQIGVLKGELDALRKELEDIKRSNLFVSIFTAYFI